MCPSIDVDDEVFDVLKESAEPFVDTPNSVLRRILGVDREQTRQADYVPSTRSSSAAGRHTLSRKRPGKPKNADKNKKSGRAARGTLLPESEYELPILRYLDEHGGRAPSREVVDGVGEALADRLTDEDKQKLHSGDVRWKNRAAFVRLRLIERKELNGQAPRGTWEITDKGRERLRSAS